MSYLNGNTKKEPSSPTKKREFDPKRDLLPIKGIELYNSSVVVRRWGHNSECAERDWTRKEIMNLSKRSLARLAFIAFNTPAHFPSMMTLTYPATAPMTGKTCKAHLNSILQWYRRNFDGHLYLWWLEFQRRGAPHFHILSTVDMEQRGGLARVKRANGDVWETHWDTWQALEVAWRRLGGGHTAWERVRDQEGGKKYAAAYATKAYQKAVPEGFRDVGRFWGHSRDGVKPEPVGEYVCDEESLRAALERGGWEHLPGDEGFIYSELYQAASKIDVSGLRTVGEAMTPRGQYVCRACGAVADYWAGQCKECNEFNTMEAKEKC